MKKLSLLLALSAIAGAANAQLVPAYDNTTTFAGSGYVNGGATATSAITTLVADDINFAAGSAGLGVRSFTFSVANFDTATFTARPRVRFYAADGTGGAPGTFIAGFSFNPISFAPGVGPVNTADFGAATPAFTIPTNLKIWAGITFDNVGATATAANLNNLGQGLYNPPTVGTSADQFFQTSASGSFLVNNPAGSVFNAPFAGTTANFGWTFNVQAVPEPSAFAALGLGVVAVLRRRSKKA